MRDGKRRHVNVRFVGVGDCNPEGCFNIVPDTEIDRRWDLDAQSDISGDGGGSDSSSGGPMEVQWWNRIPQTCTIDLGGCLKASNGSDVYNPQWMMVTKM